MSSLTLEDLSGINAHLDHVVADFAFLAQHYAAFHPANAGDVSQVLPDDTAGELIERFQHNLSAWQSLETMQDLAKLRNDGRTGYRSEGIREERFYKTIEPLAGKVLLITRTGAQLPALWNMLSRGQAGRLVNLIQLDEEARRIRIVYGNVQFGSIPSIETHIHLLANAVSVAEGYASPAAVHAHPHNLVLLGRHDRINGDVARFNAILHTQVEGLNRNYPSLVGIIRYFESGSAALAMRNLDLMGKHRLILWMNHGFLVRDADITRAYTLMSYAEECAQAALDSLVIGATGLPLEATRIFLEENGLIDAYRDLRPSEADRLTGSETK